VVWLNTKGIRTVRKEENVVEVERTRIRMECTQIQNDLSVAMTGLFRLPRARHVHLSFSFRFPALDPDFFKAEAPARNGPSYFFFF
jgi:hypothetical protein